MNEEYQDLVDEAEDEFEQSQDLQDSQLDQYEAGYGPTGKPEQSIYNWFWRITRLKTAEQLARVGNLNNAEIGDHGVSMRDALNLAHLGHLFGHEKFGDYWAERSKITSQTSMARKGWFMDLSISQKKVRERARQSSSSGDKQKWRLFNKGNKDQGQGQAQIE